MPWVTLVRVAAGAASAIGLVLLYGALAVVGLASWRRTSAIRHGRAVAVTEPQGPPRSETSAATYLPALAGFDLSILGSAGAATGHHVPPFFAVAVAGGLVALLGVTGRVAQVQVNSDGLVVSYAGRGRFELPWTLCRRLAPPHTPLGGWRVAGAPGSRILMPSDLLGREDVLLEIVHRSGLQFDGKHWVSGTPLAEGVT